MSDSTVNLDENQKEVDIRMIRDSLRQILNNDKSLKNKINGVIASYNAEIVGGKIKVTMTTLPIDEENIFPDLKDDTSRDFFEKAYPLNDIQKIYSTPRPDEVIYHKRHFKENSRNTTLAHYEVVILGKEDILKYDSLKVTIGNKNYFHKQSEITEDVENPVFYLPEIWKAIESENHNFINLFDQCFLKSGTNKLLLIPIPLLSTPVFLLGTEWIEDENQRNQLIDDVYYYSKATVVHYITQKLIFELKKILYRKGDKQINNLLQLIKQFNEVLCKILLPIKWEIGEIVSECYDKTPNCSKCDSCDSPKNNEDYKCHRTRLNPQEPEKFYKVKRIETGSFMKDTWPKCKEKKIKFDYSLKIKDETTSKDYLISLKTTSFKVPERIDEGNLSFWYSLFKLFRIKPKKNKWGKDGVWIHTLPDYDISASHLSERLTSTFELIYQQWKQMKEIEKHALQSAISRIINRNYAHHIGSHVSMRATMDKIIERNTGEKPKESLVNLPSYIEMENRLTRYKDERNDFIAGIDNNSQPVTLSFYKDIIQPFIENSLIMDNIAKSEGISWDPADANNPDGKVNPVGISKLRIRVFYHKDIAQKDEKAINCTPKQIAHKNCECSCVPSNGDQSLTLCELGIKPEEWNEMVAHYTMVNGEEKNLCIHQLPYFKKSKEGENRFFEDIDYTLSDIEVAVPGTLGTHSIYSILENHIRNTAKHADRSFLSKANHLDIIIKISKKDEDYFNFELTSNIPTIKKGDNGAILEDIKNKKLKEPINAEAKSLGFADMRINATLLAFEEITQENLDNNITAGVYSKNSNEHKDEDFTNSLKYEFRLTKPCKIVFVGNSIGGINDGLIDKGYRKYSTAIEAIEALGTKPRSFQFAVVDRAVFNELSFDNPKTHPDLFLKHLPWRVLVTGNCCDCSPVLQKLVDTRRVTCAEELVFESQNEARWLELCWEKWLNGRWNGGFDLSLYFEEVATVGATKRYKEKSDSLSAPCKPFIFFKHDNQNRNSEYDSNKNFIIYDRHGTFGFNSFKSRGSNPLEKKKNYSWVYLDKNNPDFDKIYLDKLETPVLSFSKLIESGLHRILVIDERARESALTKSKLVSNQHKKSPRILSNQADKMLFGEEALNGRIYITDSCKLNDIEILYDSKIQVNESSNMQIELSNAALKFTSSFFPEYNNGQNDLSVHNACFDTLIIHRTILNKILDDKQSGRSIFDLFSNKFPNIIVTTGGGTISYPGEVMNRIKTVPFFTIHKSILNGSIAKNLLTNII
jgi:hypothetical protein